MSTKSLGDGNSYPKSMIRLKSGALMIGWNEEGYSYSTLDGSLNTGFAYRSASGNWMGTPGVKTKEDLSSRKMTMRKNTPRKGAASS